jgi:hypothetical protein
MLPMSETIKVEVDQSLAKRFRKKAMEKYGYKKGAVKKALEEAMRKYSAESKADWGSLLGTMKLAKNSVWLQHHAWEED